MESREITVRDKNGNFIAVFSNTSACNADEIAENLMIAPTINLVSNGESTLSFQMLKSSIKWQQIKDPENIYECNGREYTALNEHSIVYNGDVVTVTLVETWYLLNKKYVQAYNVDTEVEALDDHTVKILPKSTETLYVNGTAYSDSEVKDSRGELMPRGSAGYALWAILKGSGWSLGVCDVIDPEFNPANDWGCFNIETDMKDVLYNVQFVQKQYGGILVWDSKNKTLSLRSESVEGSDFNTWKGYSVRKSKNMQESPTITWDNNIITRLYVLGQDNLNIKSINGDKGYIEDFSYTSSVYEGYLQNANIYDTDDSSGKMVLLYWGKQQIKKYSRPRKSISYSVVDIRGNEEDEFHEEFDINDIVKAYYIDDATNEEVEEELRIQHLQYNYFFPGTDSVIEVGDKIANEVEIFHEIYKKSTQEVVVKNASNQVASAVVTTVVGSVAGSLITLVLTELAKLALKALIGWITGFFPFTLSASTSPRRVSASRSSPTTGTKASSDLNLNDICDVLSIATDRLKTNADATDDDVTELLAYVNEKIGDLGTNEDGSQKTVKQYVDEKIAEISAK